ncbi:MAG: DUF4190 domain-containing protein [Microbacteriaceae bacterium]|nr:DUF4190 domain-containing protein [Microbacteriaceae bacterium]
MATTTSNPTDTPAIAAPAPAATTNGFSITALVLGITGIVLGQWLLSVVAVVIGFVARSKEPAARLMANWGLVLGFVGVFGGILLGIIGLTLFAPLAFWGVVTPWDFANIGLWDVWNR